ncbi:hypothetical protein [Candidatus Poriferisodalis sp.]|uniref:hypothetical protein n=1 Tax=Candidatus Poriferisodalis sp. TaxID=3101277 RepID=UPI003C6F8BD6
MRPLLTEQVEILQTHKDNYDNNPHWTAVVELDDARYQDSPWYHFNLTQEEIDADDRHSGLSLQFGAEVPVTVKTMVIADLISTLLDDLLESAVREELGEPYTVGASLWPLIEVGMWDNYLRASVPTESLEQTNSTVVETVAALIASRPAEADLAQAKSALRDRYQLDRNSEIIEALLQRRHLDDALVGTPEHRLAVLDEITTADVQRYVSLFFNLDNRIELFLSAE